MSEPEEIDTEYTAYPTCPHCGKPDSTWWDGEGLYDDGDEVIRDCGRCEKPMKITIHISPTFTTEKTDERPRDLGPDKEA